MRLLLLIITFLSVAAMAAAQKTVTISGAVTDGDSGEPLQAATVTVASDHPQTLLTDAEGHFAADVKVGKECRIKVTFVGYKTFTKVVSPSSAIYIKMRSDSRLREVVVTARQSGGPVTSSLIGRDAMRHLQPNSIADLMERVSRKSVGISV